MYTQKAESQQTLTRRNVFTKTADKICSSHSPSTPPVPAVTLRKLLWITAQPARDLYPVQWWTLFYQFYHPWPCEGNWTISHWCLVVRCLTVEIDVGLYGGHVLLHFLYWLCSWVCAATHCKIMPILCIVYCYNPSSTYIMWPFVFSDHPSIVILKSVIS